MRESIATALYQGLGDELDKDTPITRITAFAGSTRLGTLLWRVKYANDPKAFRPAVLLIVKAMPGRTPWHLRARIADWCLREWLHDMCRTCLGAKYIMADERKIVCATCDGLGKHRYTNRERSLGMGMDAIKLDPLMAECARVISEHDIRTEVTTAQRLDRL